MDSSETKNQEQFLSLAEASKLTGYHQDYLGQLCRGGKLFGQKVGRNWLTTRAAVDDLMAGTQKAAWDAPFQADNLYGDAYPIPEEPSTGLFASRGKPVSVRVIHFTKLSPTLDISGPNDNDDIGQAESSPGLSGEALSRLSKSFRRQPLLTFRTALTASLVLVAGVALSVLAEHPELAKKFAGSQNPVNFIVYQPARGAAGKAAENTSAALGDSGKVLGETQVRYVQVKTAAPSDSDLSALILNNLQKLSASGLFKGEKGDTGPQGLAGAQGASGPIGPQGPVTHSGSGIQAIYAPVGAVNSTPSFNGAILSSATSFSAKFLTADTSTVSGALTANGLTVTNGATLSGPVSLGPNSTFNPGFTAGSVVFQGASALVQDNANFFYDSANHRLGLGSTTPATTLYVEGASTITGSETAASTAGSTFSAGNTTGALTLTGSTVTLGATAAALTLQTTTSGDINFTPAGNINLNNDTILTADKTFSAATGAGAVDFSAATGTFKTSTGANSLNGDVTVASGKNFAQTGTGTFGTGTGAVSLNGATSVTGANTFATGTGAISLNGDTTIAAAKSLLAAGTAIVDFSGGSGIFKTTTGAVTIGPAATTLSGTAINLSGASPVIDLTSATTLSINTTTNRPVTFGTGLTTLGGNLTVSGATTSLVSTAINLTGASPVLDLTSASTLSINTTTNRPVTFGTGAVTIPNLVVTNSQGNSGNVSITSNTTTGTVLAITGTALTSGTGISKTITANAGNGQVTTGESITITDATVAGGGYTGVGVSVTGSGVGSGNKYLLQLNPGTNKEVVFDSTGALRPTTNVSTNTNTLGSSSFYWKNVFTDTVTANNLSGTVVSGATASTTWTIGSTEVGDTNEALIFQRNSGSGNATLQWNAGAGDLRYLTANYPLNATYTVSDASIGTGINLLSANLTNNTTAGTQKLLSLTNTGTGATENGIYLNNTGTGATGIEIAGAWTTGILTNNNSINAGTGAITSGLINGQTISSAANFTGTVAAATSLSIAGGTALTTTNQTGTGSIVLSTSPTLVTPALGTPSALVGTNITGTGASFTAGSVSNATLTTALTVNTGAVTLVGNAAGSTLTLGAGASSVSGSNTGDQTLSGLGGANTALSNLASVAINTALIPNAAAGFDFGSATLPWKDIYLAGTSLTPGTNNFKITGASTSGTRVLTLADGNTTLQAGTTAITGGTLAQFAATTSAELAGVISDETGSGAAVFGTAPSFTTSISTPSILTASGALAITPAAGSNLNISLATTGDLAVNTNQLYVDTSTGNVGIGTASPATKLEVNIGLAGGLTITGADNGGAYNLIYVTNGASYNANNSDVFHLYKEDAAGGWTFDSTKTGTGTARPISFGMLGSPKMTVDTTGNVGIGTATPTSILAFGGDAARTIQLEARTTNAAGSALTVVAGAAGAGATGFAGGQLNLTGGAAIGTTGAAAGGDVRIAGGAGINTGAAGNVILAATAGNVGVGTTAPAAPLHVAGQCVTGDTKLRRRRKKKKKTPSLTGDGNPLPNPPHKGEGTLTGGDGGDGHGDWIPASAGMTEDDVYIYDSVRIDQIQAGDEILSLNETTGKFEYQKVRQLADMGVKQIWKLTTASGKSIRTTKNHPYLVRLVTDLAMLNVDNQNQVRFSQQKFNPVIADPHTKILPFALKFNYIPVLQRMTQFFQLGNFGKNIQPDGLGNIQKFFGSSRVKDNPRHKEKYYFVFLARARTLLNGIQDLLQSASLTNPVVSLAVSGLDNSIKSIISSSNFLESTLAGASTPRRFLSSMIVRDEVAGIENKVNDKVYSYEHDNIPNERASIDNGRWTKVIRLRVGQEIAVTNKDKTFAVWDRIAKIEILPSEQVYDIEVEGTHNFVGNDIVAHNTVIFGVGEAGTPTVTTIRGAAGAGTNIAGANLTFDASNGTGTGGSGALVFRTAPVGSTGAVANTLTEAMRIQPSGNVGIGTTSPNGKLDVIGSVTASANYGLSNIGPAATAFDGATAGFFVGSAAGTELAINAVSGFTGNLADFQVAGSSKFKIDASGHLTLEGVTSTGATGTGALVFATSPTLVTPVLGVASATSLAVPAITTASGALTITPAAGSNLNINLSTTGDLAVNTNQLYVDTSTGNVGIGTTAPGAKLEILNGFNNYKFTGANGTPTIVVSDINTGGKAAGLLAGGSGAAFIFDDAGFFIISKDSNANIAGGTTNGGTELMRVTSTGNVGIGTTAPNGKLDVIGSVTASANYGLSNIGPAATAFDGATAGFFVGSAAGTELAINAVSGFTGNLADFQVAGSSKFKIDASGHLTLEGVTSTGATGTGALVFATSPTLITPVLGVASATSLAVPAITTASGALTITPAAGSNLNINLATTGDLAVNTNQLYVDTSTGNVGIGTTGPAQKLEVYGSGTVLGQITSSSGDAGFVLKASGTGNYSFIDLNHGATNYWEISSNPSLSQNFDIYSRQKTGGGASVFDITKDGNVGIGTTAPKGKLDVIGSVTASANYGLSNIGPAATAFDGATAGFFAGSASGTELAINAVSGFTGNLADFQVAGSSKFKIDASGHLTLEGVTSTGATGTGALVFATSPTLVTPALGTPSALVGTNITGTGASFTAGTATNLAGGSGGTIPYQSSAGVTAMLANGTAGQVLQSNGTTLAPSWTDAGASLSGLTAATGTHTLANANFAQTWNWGTLTTETGLTLGGGTAMTTGSILSVGSGTFVHTALNDTGSLAKLTFTDASTNANDGGVTSGLNIASTLNTTGAGTKTINAANIAAPTITACTTGACTWNGYNVNTLTSGALATLTSNGLNISATGISAGTLNGINISNITAGAGTETALKIGTGWDTAISVGGNIVPAAAPTISSQTTTLTSVDTTIGVDVNGLQNSLAIGTDGLAVIAYYDATNGDLKVVKCGNALCSSGNTTTSVDTANDVGQWPSITIGTDGFPIISYYYVTGADLKVVHCTNASCSTSDSPTSVETTNDIGKYTSIAIGVDGFPIVSYYDNTNADLRVVHCTNASCSTSDTPTAVDSTGTVGDYTSIAIAGNGLPVISFHRSTVGLGFAKCGNLACSSGNTVSTAVSGAQEGYWTSIAIGTDSLPIVSYWEATSADLRVVKCGNAFCNSGNTTTTVESTNDVGRNTSLAIGRDGLPVISYYDNTNGDLRVTKCGNISCSSANLATAVDTTNNVGKNTFLRIPPDGLPIIAYYDQTNGGLRVAKCGDPTCSLSSGNYYSAGADLGSIGSFFKNVYAAQYWGRQFQITNFDLAESYEVAEGESLEAGDVAALNEDGKLVQASTDSPNILGVISTSPAILLSDNPLPQSLPPGEGNGGKEPSSSSAPLVGEARRGVTAPVALAGRVPVKVTDENGPIKPGDYLTTSKEFPGYAAKAINSGQVIGKALESFVGDPTIPAGNGPSAGKILVFVNLTYYQPKVADIIDIIQQADGKTQLLADLQNLNLTDASAFPKLVVTDKLYVGGEIIVKGHLAVGKDTAGSAVVKEGSQRVVVKFALNYDTVPKVVATPDNFAQFRVVQKSASGFVIELNTLALADVSFDWVALASPDSQTFVGNSGPILLPVSSNTANTTNTTNRTDGGTNATNATDTANATNTTNGTNMTNATNRTDETNTTDATNTTNTTNGTNMTNATNRTDETNTANETNATDATNTTNATNGTNATDATNTTNGTNMTNATNGTNRTDETNTANGTNATDATDTTNATNGTNMTNATNGTDGTNTTDATNATDATDSANSQPVTSEPAPTTPSPNNKSEAAPPPAGGETPAPAQTLTAASAESQNP